MTILPLKMTEEHQKKNDMPMPSIYRFSNQMCCITTNQPYELEKTKKLFNTILKHRIRRNLN